LTKITTGDYSSNMTAGDLIDALGGATELAEALGIKPNAVSMMRARGVIPPRHHMALWRLAQERGVNWAPPGAPKPARSGAEAA